MPKTENTTKFLTKEEELTQGALVQKMVKAQERMNDKDNLTEEEIIECEKDIRVGKNAVDVLLKANMGLVYGRARSFRAKYPGAPELEDLVQDGMAGLLTAIYRYDPSRGNKLSTMAIPWIFQSITRWTNKTGRLVKLPENRVTDFSNISKLRTQLENDGLTQQEADEFIMKSLNLSKVDMFHITNAAATPASLNKKVSDDEGAKELMDLVSDNHVEDSSETFVMKNEMFEILRDRLVELDEIHRDIISSSFMFENANGEKMTAKQVREKHNISTTKFKKLLNESLLSIKTDLDKMDISYRDFIE